MIRKFAPAAVLLLTVACATTPMTSSSSTGLTTAAAAPQASASNAPDYVLLSSPGAVRQFNAINAPYALHIRGTMTSNGFTPAGGVQGRGKLCADGQDWLSLSDLKIHKASEGGTKTAPYILGCASGTSFVPASREVVTQ